MKLKGSVLVLVTLIFQVVALVVMFFSFSLIPIALNILFLVIIYRIYTGYNEGEEKWINIALVTGLILIILGILAGSISISGILLLVAGFVAKS